MILALVLSQYGRSVALISQPEIVYELYSALPIAMEYISRRRRINLILPADKIPHEIPPVHPPELIVEEEAQIGSHRRLFVRNTGHFGPLPVHIRLVEFLIPSVRTGSPHPREKHFPFRKILGLHRRIHFLVLSAKRSPILLGFQIVWRVKILSIQKRCGAVLLPGKIPYKGKRIIRLIFIGRSLCA